MLLRWNMEYLELKQHYLEFTNWQLGVQLLELVLIQELDLLRKCLLKLLTLLGSLLLGNESASHSFNGRSMPCLFHVLVFKFQTMYFSIQKLRVEVT